MCIALHYRNPFWIVVLSYYIDMGQDHPFFGVESLICYLKFIFLSPMPAGVIFPALISTFLLNEQK